MYYIHTRRRRQPPRNPEVLAKGLDAVKGEHPPPHQTIPGLLQNVVCKANRPKTKRAPRTRPQTLLAPKPKVTAQRSTGPRLCVVGAATGHGGPCASHTWMIHHPGSSGASFEAQLGLWRPLEAERVPEGA